MRPPAPKKPPTKKAPAKAPANKKAPAKKTRQPAPPTSDKNHDCGPWIEVTKSSRVSRFRYDYGERELQVAWKNGRGHVHTTYTVEDSVYRSFATAASKGKRVNTHLNGYGYRPSTNEEVNAPSNPHRKAGKTVDKGSGYAGWNDDGSARIG
jgi:hypothetical protein